jgi:plasmid stabilization system protein ParE
MKEPLAVVFQRRAARDLEEIDAWWKQNRPAAPDMFLLELQKTLAVVALVPTLGAPARSERVPNVRRVVMRKTQYHLYYRVRDETLEVLSVWHVAREGGPAL